MKQAVETGKDKVKKICEVLRKETLEPAMTEAQEILDNAKVKAEQIIEEARSKAAKIKADAEKETEKKQKIFQSSLSQGGRQSLEWLKQEIEQRLLNQNLAKLIDKASSTPEVLAKMIEAVIGAIKAEGLEADLSAIIPASVEARAVNELLGKELLDSLKEKSVLIGTMKGGIEMKLHKENITIDISDTALLDLMTRYVRKDFHKFFFAK
ncbi:MAG: V-type proton ATPase subunit E [Chlamydiae bacterium]|nr:V-type proton ATPase subunit E [Chlamydiota bacterium]